MNVLYVYDTPGRYALLRGRLLAPWLRARRIPALKSPPDRGYLLHRDRLADTLAAAEESGVVVHLRREVAS